MKSWSDGVPARINGRILLPWVVGALLGVVAPVVAQDAPLGLDAGDAVTFTCDEDGARIQREVGASPFTRWRGHLTDLKGADIDRLVDEMRGR